MNDPQKFFFVLVFAHSRAKTNTTHESADAL